MFKFKKSKRNDLVYDYLCARGWDLQSAEIDAGDFAGHKGLIKYLFMIRYHNQARGLIYCDWRA